MSIVLDLQKLALDSKADNTELLRLVYFAARKLKVESLKEWADNESNGYKNATEVPPYRIVRGELRVRNPYHVWLPVAFETDPGYAEMISTLQAGMPVSEIQALLKGDDSNGYVMATYPTEVEQHLRATLITDTGYQPNFQPKLRITKTRLHAVLDAIRQQVLDLAMKLEEDGILGENMTFNQKEIQMAATHNYTNSIIYQGNVQNAQAQGTANSSSQTMTIGTANCDTALKQILENIQQSNGVTDSQVELAEAHAGTLMSQARIPAEQRNQGLIDKGLKGLSAISAALSISKNAHDLIPVLVKFFT